jgi:uncharacterized protein HemX
MQIKAVSHTPFSKPATAARPADSGQPQDRLERSQPEWRPEKPRLQKTATGLSTWQRLAAGALALTMALGMAGGCASVGTQHASGALQEQTISMRAGQEVRKLGQEGQQVGQQLGQAGKEVGQKVGEAGKEVGQKVGQAGKNFGLGVAREAKGFWKGLTGQD